MHALSPGVSVPTAQMLLDQLRGSERRRRRGGGVPAGGWQVSDRWKAREPNSAQGMLSQMSLSLL